MNEGDFVRLKLDKDWYTDDSNSRHHCVAGETWELVHLTDAHGIGSNSYVETARRLKDGFSYRGLGQKVDLFEPLS